MKKNILLLASAIGLISINLIGSTLNHSCGGQNNPANNCSITSNPNSRKPIVRVPGQTVPTKQEHKQIEIYDQSKQLAAIHALREKITHFNTFSTNKKSLNSLLRQLGLSETPTEQELTACELKLNNYDSDIYQKCLEHLDQGRSYTSFPDPIRNKYSLPK